MDCHFGRHSVLSLLECVAGTTGLEPATSAVTGQRSNQLSYVPRLYLGKWKNFAASLKLQETHSSQTFLLLAEQEYVPYANIRKCIRKTVFYESDPESSNCKNPTSMRPPGV